MKIYKQISNICKIVQRYVFVNNIQTKFDNKLMFNNRNRYEKWKQMNQHLKQIKNQGNLKQCPKSSIYKQSLKEHQQQEHDFQNSKNI